MPVYNEIKTLKDIIIKIKQVPLNKELIIIDDGSQDGSRDYLKSMNREEWIKVVFHEQNQGKGAAIHTGIQNVTGDIITIQDADLEYDPNDFVKLIKPIVDRESQVVYGSRLLNRSNEKSYYRYYIGGRLITLLANLLYGQNLTDEPTCYKVFDAKLLQSIPLNSRRFGFCPEVTAKVSKRKIKIRELPIRYYPRKMKEGKKIRWHDGIEAIWILFKHRFIN